MKKTLKKKKIQEKVKAEEEIDYDELRKTIPAVRKSDDPPTINRKWVNKQRVLVLASRGITYRERHLMLNLKALMPHSKSGTKVEKQNSSFELNEICEMKNCNKCIYFENRRKTDLYMWISNAPSGPSVKCLVENIHTMEELKMTGNCLKGSRPILSFDPSFDRLPHWELLKELFIQVFGTPFHHPRSQPFVDHVYTFTVLDGRIWFRNYQIMEEDGSLVEIGPRFVLNPICIFEGSFGGEVLYNSPTFVPPHLHRKILSNQASNKYEDRLQHRENTEFLKPKSSYKLDPYDVVFETTEETGLKRKQK